MKEQTKLILLVAALAVLLVGAYFLYQFFYGEAAPDRLAATQPPQKSFAPDFTVYTQEGEAVKLSDFRGKPVILNFWASWCGPCKSEMPDFETAFAAYGEQVHFLMVNATGGSDTMEAAQALLQEADYTFPVYYDLDADAAAAYGITAFPTTYFIDAEGYGVAYGMGALDAQSLQTGIDMLLEE